MSEDLADRYNRTDISDFLREELNKRAKVVKKCKQFLRGLCVLKLYEMQRRGAAPTADVLEETIPEHVLQHCEYVWKCARDVGLVQNLH